MYYGNEPQYLVLFRSLQEFLRSSVFIIVLGQLGLVLLLLPGQRLLLLRLGLLLALPRRLQLLQSLLLLFVILYPLASFLLLHLLEHRVVTLVVPAS